MATPRRQALLKAGGFALAAVALGLCVYALARDWDRVSAALRDANPWALGGALVLSAGSMQALAVLWHRCLAALGVRARVGEVSSWYFVGELGKYIPGGVWQVVGRSELAYRRHQINRSTSYASTLLAYGAMTLGAVFVCALASPWFATGTSGTAWAWLLLPGVVVVPVVIHPRVVGAAVGVVARLSRRDLQVTPLSWRTMAALLAWSLPAWVLLGGASAALAAGLGSDGNEVRIAVAAVAAWLIGFLAVPVPAGAGVREVVFAVFSGLAAGPAVAVALLARALLIVVDAAGGLVSIGIHRVADRRAARTP